MLESAALAHPSLAKNAKQNPGIFTPKEKFAKQAAQCTFVSIGDPYQDAAKRESVNKRFTGRQFMTRPLLDKSAGRGYFSEAHASAGYMKGDTYVDKDGYIKTQPLDSRKLGFGIKDASRRDEFMSFIRTEQYRQTIKDEKKIVDAQEERNDPGGKGRKLLLESFAKVDAGFPEGLTEARHGYDIGRSLNTAFDPKSSRDCFYNQLMSPSRIRPDRRTGGQFVSAAEYGNGVAEIEMEHPHHGHVRATKTFYDRSHLG